MVNESESLLIFALVCSLIFVAAFSWCFCCGTCVGRDLLRSLGLKWCLPRHERVSRMHPLAVDEDVELWIESSQRPDSP
ncbi:uncharacterized protein VTP21DRAFT_7153 [Calcarisporiella thermophila]|uniref:uncharacterized protein n=1 Tax=Calcarisporiella thermophila TaxID=911321 RepID=UPI0037447FFD